MIPIICPGCGEPVSVPVKLNQPVQCSACGQDFAWNDGVLVVSQAASVEDYPTEYYELLVRTEPRHFWFGGRNRVIEATLRAALGPLAGRTVVDVGCGTGFVLAALEQRGMVVCGLDMHLEGLRFARRRLKGLLVCDAAGSVPVRDFFDVGLLCDVIEHSSDDIGLIQKTRAAVRAGGTVLVTVPAQPRLWTPIDEVSGHKRRYTREGLVAAMQAAGLRDVKAQFYNTLLFPIQVIQRRALAGYDTHSSAERDALVYRFLQVPLGPVSLALRALVAIDISLHRVLTPLGVGTSLIAVGTR